MESDFLFTAVGGKNMRSVGETIGKALRKVLETDHVINVVTCENWVDPAKDLRAGIESQLNVEELEKLHKNVGISESVIVATGTGSPDGKKPANPMDTWIQDIRYLPVDSGRLVGKLPEWEGFEAVEHFGNLLTQKLYTNNTSCTAMSYIGLRYGYTYLCDACNDPYLETILDELYREINIALIDGMGIDRESQLAFSRRAKQKYTDKNIIDPMTRIARDPVRKLKPQDRPMLLSEFGGYSYAVSGHTTTEKAYGYGACKSKQELTDRIVHAYEEMVLPAVRSGLCGSVYTQVSDVEDELNGLLTYDRRVLKIDKEVLKNINARVKI